MKELKTSMDTIRHTAGKMIDELSIKMRELLAERNVQRQEEKKEKFLPAMEAAGYYFDEKGSTDDHLRSCRTAYISYQGFCMQTPGMM